MCPWCTLDKRTKAPQSEQKEHATIVTTRKPPNNQPAIRSSHVLTRSCALLVILDGATLYISCRGRSLTIVKVQPPKKTVEANRRGKQSSSWNQTRCTYRDWASLHSKEKSSHIKGSCSKCEVWAHDCDHVCISNTHCGTAYTTYI